MKVIDLLNKIANGEIDLSQEEYNELRQLIVVAIGVMEEMRNKYCEEDNLEIKGEQ